MAERDKKLEEKISKANLNYSSHFNFLVRLNRINGRDHEVLTDYLECRDAELKGVEDAQSNLDNLMKKNKFNYFFTDQIFEHLESKVVNRIRNRFYNSKGRCSLAKEIIEEWVNKQGHDQCWYYPEIFKKLTLIFDAKIPKDIELPARDEFLRHCEIYCEEIYSKNKDI